MKTIFWTGYCNDERYGAINKIKSIISEYGALVDFKLFSDISLSIKIEIIELNIDNLYNALSQTMGIDKFEYLNSNSRKEIIVYLNITFNKGTGNLKIEVPSVPG
jgi:hypothetical protein